VENYPAPSAGENVPGGGYPAPTPHAAQVGQEPYRAPEADLNELANTGFEMTKETHTWTSAGG